MTSFISNKIHHNDEIIAEYCRESRIEKKLKLAKIAQELNINEKYLIAIEKGQLEKLPTGLYGKKILKEYADYLKLDSDAIITLYDKETISQNNLNQKQLFARQAPHVSHFLTIPKIIKGIIIGAVILICVAYLGYYLKNIISPPDLIIVYPEDNLVTASTNIEIQGKTEIEAEVTVNNELVLTDKQGYFKKEISLNNGVNTVHITSKKKYSKTNSIVRRILVKPE